MKRDSLSRLITRSLGLSDVIQPVLPSRFEPNSSVPSFRSMSFGADEKRQRPVEPLSSAFHPAAPKVHSFEQIRQKDVNASGSSASAPLPVSSPLIESPLRSRPPARSLSADGSPGDEDSAGRHSRNEGSAAGPSFAIPPVRLPESPGRHKQTGRPSENERASRYITPAEVHARQPGPAAPEPEMTEGDVNQESFGQEVVPHPTVTVHIGRIEVRAIAASGSEPERKHPADNRQRLTLADYLQQREKGTR